MNEQLVIQTYQYLRYSINAGRHVVRITENEDGTVTVSYKN